MNIEKILNRVIEYSFYLLLFLVPLIVTQWNYELFEYNKMMLTYGLTIVIAATWTIKMIIAKQFLIKRTPFDIPILIFLASQILATIFSIDRHTSLWGYYSRFHGGLLSTISYLLLFYAFVSNFDKKKALNALYWLLSAAAVVSVYAILEHFGRSISCLMFEGKFDVSCWVQDVQNRVFATMGQPNWLAAWLIPLIPVSFAIGIKKPREIKIAAFLLACLFYLALLYTKSRSGLLAFGATYLVFWAAFGWINKKHLKKLLFLFVSANLVLGIITAVTGSPWTPSIKEIATLFVAQAPQPATTGSPETPIPTIVPTIKQVGTESGEIRNIVWKGAIEVWKHYPLFGSGVETFAYSYYQFRPAEHNLISEWDFLYNKAHNEYLNFLATTGLVGLGSYLLFILVFTIWFLKIPKSGLDQLEIRSIRNFLLPALFAGWASILITNFFGFSVVPVALLFFLYPGFAFMLTQEEQSAKSTVHREKEETLNWPQKISILLFALCAIYLLLRLAQFWYADTLFAKGNRANKMGEYKQSLNFLQKAVDLNPGEPVYRDELGWSAANLAVLASEQKQTQLVAPLVNLALSSSDQALSVSSRNMNFWKTRAKIFYQLSIIDPQYIQSALETLLAAKQLAPTDAKIAYNLGLVYSQLGKVEESIKILEETVMIKANYTEARYILALLYHDTGELDKAVEQLKYVVTYIDPGHPDANQKLKEWGMR